ncbi:uncharacterized protein [Apostichopus japonicus]|uniref:uncharacterized protein isoform X2 n=1 Tax=Stichopus japonicus TaxID=307972 RepID=UPI003AB79CF3
MGGKCESFFCIPTILDKFFAPSKPVSDDEVSSSWVSPGTYPTSSFPNTRQIAISIPTSASGKVSSTSGTIHGSEILEVNRSAPLGLVVGLLFMLLLFVVIIIGLRHRRRRYKAKGNNTVTYLDSLPPSGCYTTVTTYGQDHEYTHNISNPSRIEQQESERGSEYETFSPMINIYEQPMGTAIRNYDDTPSNHQGYLIPNQTPPPIGELTAHDNV